MTQRASHRSPFTPLLGASLALALVTTAVCSGEELSANVSRGGPASSGAWGSGVIGVDPSLQSPFQPKSKQPIAPNAAIGAPLQGTSITPIQGNSLPGPQPSLAIGNRLNQDRFRTLPCTVSQVTLGATTYRQCGDNWFRRAYVRGEVWYTVVRPPPGQ